MKTLLRTALLVLPLAVGACGGDDDEGSLVNARRRPSTGKADDPNGGAGARTRTGGRLRDLGLDRPTCLALAACCERVPDLLKPSCATSLEAGGEGECGEDLRAFSTVCGID